LVVATALLAGVANAQDSSQLPADRTPPATDRKEIRCEHDGRTGDRAGSEAVCLRQVGTLASRDGAELKLRLLNGKTKTYRSAFTACATGDVEHCTTYRLAGFFPAQQLVLINAGAYESGHWILLSRRSGAEIELAMPPHFSPSGRRLVTANDTESGDSGVDIWSVASDPPKLEFRHRPPEQEYELYSFKAWDGDDRVEFNAQIRFGSEIKSLPAELSRFGGRWQLRVSR
jgi:hypothetical protein